MPCPFHNKTAPRLSNKNVKSGLQECLATTLARQECLNECATRAPLRKRVAYKSVPRACARQEFAQDTRERPRACHKTVPHKCHKSLRPECPMPVPQERPQHCQFSQFPTKLSHKTVPQSVRQERPRVSYNRMPRYPTRQDCTTREPHRSVRKTVQACGARGAARKSVFAKERPARAPHKGVPQQHRKSKTALQDCKSAHKTVPQSAPQKRPRIGQESTECATQVRQEFPARVPQESALKERFTRVATRERLTRPSNKSG